MKEFFAKVFTDESGNPSCPRVLGAIVLIAGVVAIFTVDLARGVALLTAGAGLITAAQVKSAVVGAAQANATTTATSTQTTTTIATPVTPLPPAQPAQPGAVNAAANEAPPPNIPAPTK